MKNVEFNEQEKQIIEEARIPFWGYPQFTDYFCRDEATGTWFTKEEDDYMYDAPTRYGPGQITMYSYLHSEWEKNPSEELVAQAPCWARYYIGKSKYKEIRYRVTLDDEEWPMFFWHHGWIPMEWGAHMHYAKQPNSSILGGYGSSKTTHVGMSGFVYCATIPRFKFACIAAVGSQSKPMYQVVIDSVIDTPAEKFLDKTRTGDSRYSERPNPNIRFYNGSEMIFLGADKDLTKIRSYEGDWTVVEQAESHTSLAAVNRELGSRRRGRVRGRKRLGRMTYVANSGESPELWEKFDMSETEPERYWSIALSSYDNPHLSEQDIQALHDACGNDPEEIAQYMVGEKPTGKFKDFPADAVRKCESSSLDQIMASLLEKNDPGAQVRIEKGIGHVLWSLPFVQGRLYSVYGDPGTKNPPYRGTGTVFVIDETDFPSKPAELVHMEWVAGDNRIGPWLDALEAAIQKYDANGQAFYDSTGDQKNLDELSFEDRHMMVEGINMTSIKYGLKLKFIRLMERGLLRWAKEISPIRQQLAKYDSRQDKMGSTLAQDLVMTFYLVAYQLAKRMTEAGGQKQVGGVRRMVRGPGGIRRARKVTRRARR